MRSETLASLHALCFTDTPRPWSAAEFEGLLARTEIFLEAHDDGFAVGRIAGPEAELLTLAVHPEARRLGVGRLLLGRFEAGAARRGATETLLEVAESNTAARRLYAAAGYELAGRRPGYYRPASGPAIDGLILRRVLPVSPIRELPETD
jgi:ribosomal-protein-alanine N-acetyltransferase